MNQGWAIPYDCPPNNSSPSVYEPSPLTPVAEPQNDIAYLDELSELDFLLPGVLDDEERTFLGHFLRSVVEKAHAHRVPSIDVNGNLVIVNRGADIHHIVKQEHFHRIGKAATRFNPLLAQLRYLHSTVQGGYGLRDGSFLSNLIWLPWVLHHDILHGKNTPNTVKTLFGDFQLDELLFAFTLFNIYQSLSELRQLLKRRRHKKNGLVRKMDIELDAIAVAAKQLMRMRPDLYKVWYHYVGEAASERLLEQ